MRQGPKPRSCSSRSRRKHSSSRRWPQAAPTNRYSRVSCHLNQFACRLALQRDALRQVVTGIARSLADRADRHRELFGAVGQYLEVDAELDRNVESELARAFIYSVLGQHQLAIAVCESLDRLTPSAIWQRERLYLLSTVAWQLGHNAQALAHIEKALQLAPDEPRLLHRRSLIVDSMSPPSPDRVASMIRDARAAARGFRAIGDHEMEGVNWNNIADACCAVPPKPGPIATTPRRRSPSCSAAFPRPRGRRGSRSSGTPKAWSATTSSWRHAGGASWMPRGRLRITARTVAGKTGTPRARGTARGRLQALSMDSATGFLAWCQSGKNDLSATAMPRPRPPGCRVSSDIRNTHHGPTHNVHHGTAAHAFRGEAIVVEGPSLTRGAQHGSRHGVLLTGGGAAEMPRESAIRNARVYLRVPADALGYPSPACPG